MAELETLQNDTPLWETSVLHATAFGYGVLAQEDEAALDPAILAYEQLVAREMGWPANFVNLG